MQQLLPEWHPQEAVLMAWPDKLTDWNPWLEEVRETYLKIIQVLNNNETPVLLLIRENEIEILCELISQCSPQHIDKLLLIPAQYNDTWLRDYGFLSCLSDQGIQALDFTFNGWGNKFNAQKDNLANQQIFNKLLRNPLKSFEFVLEGGAVEIDTDGHLLSTQLCLSNPERNGDWDADKHQQIFTELLGARKVSILQNGHLDGDDTDGHIDTLVRFTPNNGLVIQSCFNRPKDDHFAGLTALKQECDELLSPTQIFELPLPYILNSESERLPASYANYLINNNEILAPIYGEAEDNTAIDVLKAAYPNFKITPIDCRDLIQQFGSLHCITMQVPCGTFKTDIIQLATSGINILGG